MQYLFILVARRVRGTSVAACEVSTAWVRSNDSTGALGNGGAVMKTWLALLVGAAAFCASVGATPLTLEYTVTGSSPPYTYNFRLVLDNHDNSWQQGMGWQNIVFGQAPLGQGGSAPFVSWITDSSSYPVGPFTATYWANYMYGGVPHDAPIFYDHAPPSGQHWIPAGVNSAIVWCGTCNVALGQGLMAWSDAGVRIGGATGIYLEPARRVGAHLYHKALLPSQAITVPRDFTGGGSGFSIGTFEIASGPDAVNLTSITLEASGSGDDSNAFSEIGLFVDTNNNGTYEPGVDTRFGAAYSGYSADNGTLTFTDTLPYSGNLSRRFLIIAKLNGQAGYGTTFDTRVLALNGSGGPHTGFPGTVINGIHIQAPTLALNSQVGSTVIVPANDTGPGGIGRQCGTFTLTNDALDTAYLTSISILAQGSLDDAAHFAQVALYEDTNGSGAYDAADTLYGSFAAFPTDGGILTFTGNRSFSLNQTRRFFVVTKLNGTAPSGRNFYSRVEAVGLSGGTEATGVPGTFMYGLQIQGPAPNMTLSRLGAIANGGVDTVNGFTAAQPGNLIYSIANTGSQQLNLVTPVLAPQNCVNCTGVIVQQPALALSTGVNTLMILELTPLAPGAFSCTMTVYNDDPANNPYTWTISGSAAAPLIPDIAITRGATPVALAALDNVGQVSVGAQSLTYTIANPGTGTLNLTGSPIVDVSAITNISAVNITINPASSVAATGSTTFTVSFTVAAAGAFEFAVSIDNNSAKNPFYFSVTGNGSVGTPSLELLRGGTVLGATDSIGGAKTGVAKTLSYTIHNTGAAALTIAGITPSGESNCSATVTPPAGNVAPGAYATFTLEITPTADGPLSLTLMLTSNDPASPHMLTISGTAQTQSAPSGGGCTTNEAALPPAALCLLALLVALGHRLAMRV